MLKLSLYEFANLQGLIWFKCIPIMWSQGSWSVAQAGLLTTLRIPSIYPMGPPASLLVTEVSQKGGKGLAPAFHVSPLGSCHHLFTGPSPAAFHQRLGILLFQPIILHSAIKAASVKGKIPSHFPLFPWLVTAWSCTQDTRGCPTFPTSSPDSACICPYAVASDPI